MQPYYAYVNLRNKDVLVNGELVYSEERYVLTDQGRAYLRELRIKEESAQDRGRIQLPVGVTVADNDLHNLSSETM